MFRKWFLSTVLLILLFAQAAVFAEGLLTMDLSLMNTILKTRDASENPYWAYGTSGEADLSFKSSGTSNVKGEVVFKILSTGQLAALSLDKAYVKARFPDFRLTAGKTRLSWGDGFVFNSGDVLFGSTSPYVDLTANEVRSDTTWLASANFPLGSFSFLEGVILTPPVSSSLTGIALGDVKGVSSGIRLYATLGTLKMESGYVFKGEQTSQSSYHQAYLGFQGNIGPDWYAAGSFALPGPGNTAAASELFEESLNMSFGLFHMYQIDRVRSITMRLEGLIMPFQAWKEQEGFTSATRPLYGVLLYPEIAYIPSDTVNFSLRSIFSPIEMSAQMTAAAAWNVFQGFSLIGYISANIGDPTDTFAWSKDEELWDVTKDSIDGIAASVGVQYRY